MTAPMMIGLPVAAAVVVPPLAVVLLALLLLPLLLLDPQPATTTAGTASAHSATAHALVLLIESPFRCARDPLGPIRRERLGSSEVPAWRVVLP